MGISGMRIGLSRLGERLMGINAILEVCIVVYDTLSLVIGGAIQHGWLIYISVF